MGSKWNITVAHPIKILILPLSHYEDKDLSEEDHKNGTLLKCWKLHSSKYTTNCGERDLHFLSKIRNSPHDRLNQNQSVFLLLIKYAHIHRLIFLAQLCHDMHMPTHAFQLLSVPFLERTTFNSLSLISNSTQEQGNFIKMWRWMCSQIMRYVHSIRCSSKPSFNKDSSFLSADNPKFKPHIII